MHTRKTFALVSVPLAVTLLLAGCRDSVNPVRPESEALDDPDVPGLSHGGAHPRIFGAGTLGTGSPAPFSDRQEFDLDVASDLTGRSSFRDWSFVRANGTVGTLTVDADPETALLGFRDGSDACVDPARGAEFDGTGREDDGDYLAFTVAVCDNGPADSGADFYRVFVPNGPFLREGFLSSGDIVKEGATPEPGTGGLTITTSTTGGDIPGYTLSATRPDGSSVTVPFGANDTQSFPGQPAGDYRLELTDVPTSCTVVNGTNPRTVTVPDGGSVSTTFEITCEGAPQSGDLTIITSTTGENLPAGYTVAVTGPSFPAGTSAPIGPNDALSAEVTPGDYVVELRDVATNCSVTSPNPRTVSVAAGDADSTTFAVTCTGGAPTTGDLTIITSTAGENVPAGYTLSFSGPGGSGTMGIAANQTQSFPGQPAGDYTLELIDVPTNCTVVNGTNRRTVTVPDGGSVSTTFEITCTATTGDLRVTSSTTGSSLDPDGYTVTVDGVQSQPIAINNTTGVTFTGLAAGNHTVVLSGVATNCSVSGGASRTVNLASGGTATVAYSVSCTTPPGNLRVTTGTAGSSLDPNGYRVTVDGTQSQTIGINNSSGVTFTGLAAGSHNVVLSDVASNCTVSGGPSRTVNVTSGGTATVSYSVNCVTPNTAPAVNAGPDQTVLLGLLYTLNWSFNDPDNGPWSYTIHWGDGTSTSGSKSSPGSFSASHNYLLIGSKTIRVTVTDSRGASGSDTKALTVLVNIGL